MHYLRTRARFQKQFANGQGELGDIIQARLWSD